jgi:hypothetical protein
MQRTDGVDYWTHLLSWWQQRGNPKVLLLAYEHMKQDLAGSIARIAAFIDIELDDELLDVALEQTSLEFMLAHKDKYDDLLMRQRSEVVAHLPPGSDSAKVRSGQIGAHRTELDAATIAELDRIWHDVLTPHVGVDSYQELIDRLHTRPQP